MDSVGIKVTVIEARNLTNMDTPLIGKNDAYAIVKVGSKKSKTKVKKNAGASATWNESFRFILKQNDDIQISVYDEDLLVDDHIGTVRIPGSIIFSEGSIEYWYTLVRDHKNGGEVRVRIEYIPGNSDSY